MKKREGEKEGKVEKTRRKKKGWGERIYTEYLPHILLLFTLDTLYVSCFSIDMIRYHGQSNV